MNTAFIRCLALSLLACCVGASEIASGQALQRSTETATTAPAEHHARATQLLDALDAAQWERANAMLADAAAAALPPAKLKDVWEGLEQQLGKRANRAPPREETVSGTRVTSVRLEYAAMALDARVHLDSDGKVDGFRIVPATTEPADAPSDASLAEEPTTVAGLSAKLTLPKTAQNIPAVILVHGSGPNDMDESIGPNKPFRDIAHGLAARGVAVLRYTKRSKERPQDFAADFTLDDEVVVDALAAIELLRGDPRIDAKRIVIAGHSLGGMLAPRIATRNKAVRGIVLLAAPARQVHTMVPEQVRYIASLDGDIDDGEQKAIDELEQQRDAIDAMLRGGPAPAFPILGANETYWRDLGGFDSVVAATNIEIPMLILQGGRDYQVTVADDFRLWLDFAQSRPNVQTELFPLLNHLFIRGDGASSPAEYMKPGHVDESVVDRMATWIRSL